MTNGNLAYKTDFVTQPGIQKNTEDTEKRRKHREMLRRRVTFLRILYMAAIAFSATFMISKFVTVNDTASRIETLNRELEAARSYTSQKIFEMERSIDLTEVEEIATTRLDMQRPESYQMIYVDVEQEDVSKITVGEVEGAKNRIKELTDNFKKNIIELFSIK